MKVLLKESEYTFSASAKTVTLSSTLGSVELSSIYAIVNLVDNILIYNIANPLTGGTISSNVLTLTYLTTSMDDADELSIIFEKDLPAIDTDLDIQKTIDQSPIWNRYTDYETLVTAQDLTITYADFGSEISTAGINKVGLFIIGDVNTSEDCDLKILGKYESGGTDEFELDGTDVLRLWSGTGTDFKNYYVIETDTIPYIQIQAKVGTLGTAADLTILVNKKY